MRKMLMLTLVLLCLCTACSSSASPTAPPSPTSPRPTLDASQFTEREREALAFIDLLASGQYAAAVERFDATMLEALPADKLAETWLQLTQQVGMYGGARGARTEEMDPYEVAIVLCEFEYVLVDARVVYDQTGEIAGLFFVPSQSTSDTSQPELPSYIDLESIQESEVTVGSGEWATPGTLTTPLAGGPFPAIILVHGSGPNDRDESIGPNKPFRDLAWGLASQGVAVLRYEKRTKQHAAEIALSLRNLTVQTETVDDVLAAVELILESDDVDPNRVFVLGHSLGGMLIPRIAAMDSRIAGFVIMAGNTRPLEDLILEQTHYLFSLQETPAEDDLAGLPELEEQIARVKSADLSLTTPTDDLPLGVPAGYWLDLRDYRPAEASAQESRPLLILQGERDYQVTLDDFSGWQDALSGKPNVTFKLYPTLNHLFMEGDGPSTPAEYHTPGYVAASVVMDIAEWVHEQ